MTKFVLTFGAIAGIIVCVLMMATRPIWIGENGEMDMQLGEVLGYISMIVALSMIFFGVRSFRDNHLGGAISFGKAFQTGLLITLVASAIYVVGWMFYYNASEEARQFPEQYMDYLIAELKKSDASQTEIAQKTEELIQFNELYKKPLVRVGMTLMEIFPVGFVISLLSAFLLKNAKQE
ncbi:MAG TPA: DUF4199 domain-containing protein [Bacteroidetes bacterium]|nr:DUF4199 domain-containing protein [Bacteroidota bacterium]